MAEAPAAAAPAAGDTTAAPVVKDAPAAETVLAVQDAAADDTTATPEPTWRERYAGEDKKELKRLERFASEADFYKAFRDTENKLRSGRTAVELPEGATPEEIAAYRKAAGVPETPEGYGFKFPDGVTAGEADIAALNDFQSFMHERHIAPAAAKAAFDYYTKRMADGRSAQAEASEAATLEAMAELRGEWKGREFTRNMKIADEFLTKHFSELPGGLEAVNEVLALRLPNGVQVMHSPAFMRGLVAMARAYADDDALVSGDGGGGGKSMQDEYKELIAESVSNPKKFYQNENKAARLEELSGALTRQEEKRRNRAA